MEKQRKKSRNKQSLLKKFGLFVLTLLLTLTTFTTGVSADEREIYTNDDDSVRVNVDRQRVTKDDMDEVRLDLNFEHDDSIEIEDVQFLGKSIATPEYLYSHSVGENGNYKFSVIISRSLKIELENEEVKTIERQDTFIIEVNVFELDEIINNDDVESIQAIEAIEAIEVEEVKTETVFVDRDSDTVIPNGTIVRTLDRLPDKDEIGALLGEDEYVYYDQVSGVVSIVKDTLVASQRHTYSSANVTTGAILSSGVSFYWKANPSYFWEDIAFSEIFVNGLVSYCIEPTILNVSTSSATSNSLTEIGLIRVMDGVLYTSITYAQKEAMELVANYGYNYPGHQTLAYKWGSQIEVYDRVGWGFYSYGTVNPSAEIAEINRLIGTHGDKPSWNGTTQDVKPNEIITLTDPTLQYFSVSNRSTGIEVIEASGNILRVKIVSDNAILSLQRKRGSELGTSYVYTDGTSQRVGTFTLSDPGYVIKNFKFALGNFELTKKNNFNELLPGVEYSFSHNSDMSAPFATKKTSSTGIIEIKDIEADAVVYYQEIATIPGHIIDSTIYQVTIAAGETVRQTRTNTAIEGQAELIKTDGDRKLLPGVVFGLYKQDGTFIQELTTDAVGKLLTPKLRHGSYYFQEHKAPWGYWTDKTKLEFTISNHEEVLSLTMANKLIQVHIEWNKTNEDGLPLEGVGFKIRNTDTGEFVTLKHANGKEIISEDVWYTDAKGDVFIKGLITAGNYELVEVAPLEGYQEIGPIAFTVDEDQDYIDLGSLIGYSLNVGDVVNYWNRGDLVITKLDIETLEPLPGFGFNLYGPDKGLIGYFETGADGTVTLQNLRYGIHTVEEIKVNGDYGLDLENNTQEIFIEEHGVVYSVTFLNKHSDIKTSASFVELDKKEPKMVTLIDVVSYTDLRPGEKYVVTGFLMNKETNEPILINGEKVEASSTFIPLHKDGTVDVVFTFDSSELKTKTIVVFEDLYRDDILVVAHHDINDIEQTVELPDIKTSASFNGRDPLSPNIVTLVDVVTYTDLIPGREYTVNGVLMDKETESVLLIDGKEITGSTTFIPEAKDGHVEVVFTFDSNKLKTKTIVVFEDVYEEDKLVISHHDINDIEQTIEVLTVQINKVDRFSKERLNQAEFTMFDLDGNILEVKWTNEDGLVEFTIFEGETVDLKETAAPEGYLLSDEVVRVVGSKDIDGNLYTIEYFNDLMPLIQLPATGVVANPLAIIGALVLMLGALFILINARQNPFNKLATSLIRFAGESSLAEVNVHYEDLSVNSISSDASVYEKDKKKLKKKRKISKYGSKKRRE